LDKDTLLSTLFKEVKSKDQINEQKIKAFVINHRHLISQPHSKTNLTDLHKILNEKDETESLFRKHSVDGKINLETF